MSGRLFRLLRSLVPLVLAAGCCAKFAVAADAQTPGPVDFARQIQPILAEHCLGCHGHSAPEAGLQLTDPAAASRPADSGKPALVPGKPDESELIRRITADDAAERMPPEEHPPLKPAEIEQLRQWIAEGATWSLHWAYRPLSTAAPPTVRPSDGVRNDIDRYVLAALEARGIAPAPEADRYTLIKRLSYDLVGLPPSVEEVDAFVNDPSPQAYETLVERLLASPHFGERWGRHWLDLAHFADSDGYEKDRARPDAYFYRDWVIRAINDDVPFDRFTIEQLAGDLLPGSTPQQRIATGFLRQTLTNEEGGVDQEEYRVAAVFDRTDTVGTVWLGLTVGCAKCHSHKYDPLPHADYYRLFAFFNEADEINAPLPVEADDLSALERELEPLEAALAARQAELAPAELAWETEEHQRIIALPDTPLGEGALEPFDLKCDAAAGQLSAEGDAIDARQPEGTAAPERATYEIVLRPGGTKEITGLRLWALPHERLPNKGSGRAENGNFVLSAVRVYLQELGQPERLLELHRPQADFEQANFTARKVRLGTAATVAEEGWAVGDKTGESHWIQFRTRGPLALAPTTRLRVVLEQAYGGQHTLGRFRLVALTGRPRGLHLDNEAIAEALEQYPEKRVAGTREQLFQHYVHEVAADAPLLSLEEQIRQVHRRYHTRLTNVRTIGRTRLGRATRVFHRGDFRTPTDEVHPGTPGILPALARRNEQAPADRLDLARWLVAPENFLTPRVAVNHVWQHLFGTGLVMTPNDFGVRGTPPALPELLDYLAAQLSGDMHWSRKQLIRLIVHSATYRQSSRHRPELAESDPSNHWLARQDRVRVESEVVRDLCLSAAGLLSPKVGGPSVFPPMPADLAALSYANQFSWENSKGEDRYRRGLYTFFKRTIPHPNLMTFDSPDANVACPVRTVSNTPLQSLLLLNNEVHLEASQALGVRLAGLDPAAISGCCLLADAGDGAGVNASGTSATELSADGARLAYGWRLCVARPPRWAELGTLEQALAAARQYYGAHADDARQLLGSRAPEGLAAEEAAAWVTVARLMLNLDEFLTRE